MTEKKSTTSRRSTAKKTTAKKSATKKASAPKPEPTELDRIVAQQEAKVEQYNVLREKGLPIPAELRAEIDQVSTENSEPPESAQRYIRNTNNSPFRLKLARHQPGQRGIVLQARGTRGDLSPIESEDLKDHILRDNLNAGFIEIITHAEATEVISKQTTNQQAVHPAMAALRNELGQPYEQDAVTVGQSPDEAAITVARLDDGQIAFDRQGIAGRIRERGESPGTPEYVAGAEPQHRPANEDPAYLSDLRARQRGHNPADGLNVSVEPTVNTSGNKIISDGFNPDK